MKGMLGYAIGVGFLLAAEAVWAGSIHRCLGADGIPAYVSKPPPSARCELVTRYQRQGAPPYRQAEASVPAPAFEPASSSTADLPQSVPSERQASQPDRVTGASRTVSGQVYSYMQDGVRHYSSRRPRGSMAVRTIAYTHIERCYACGADNSVNFGQVRLRTEIYADEIAAAAREFGVEEAVVRAIIHAESAFNPLAVSRAGAQGLMQLMPATAKRFGVNDSFDVQQNIRGGVRYLAWLLKRFNGDLTLASAGYNAGEGAVDRHGGVPPYSETRNYVVRVRQLAERYRGGAGPSPKAP